jgi:hypothetical protein
LRLGLSNENMNKLIIISFIIFNEFFGSIQSRVELQSKSHFLELKEFLTERVNHFKLDFHRSFEKTRIKRKQKDNFIYSLPDRGGLHLSSN